MADDDTATPEVRHPNSEAHIEQLLEVARERPDLGNWYRLAIRARELTIRSLTDAYKKDPDSPKALLLEAQAAGSQSHDEEARRKYRAVLIRAPNDQNANVGLASIYIRSFQDREAMPLLDRVLHTHPTDPEASYLKGQILVFEDRDNEALPLIRNALTSTDSFLLTRAWILLAKIYRNKGLWADAINALEKIRPDYRDGRIAYQLYQLYKKVGNSEAADLALALAKSSTIHDKSRRDRIR